MGGTLGGEPLNPRFIPSLTCFGFGPFDSGRIKSNNAGCNQRVWWHVGGRATTPTVSVLSLTNSHTRNTGVLFRPFRSQPCNHRVEGCVGGRTLPPKVSHFRFNSINNARVSKISTGNSAYPVCMNFSIGPFCKKWSCCLTGGWRGTSLGGEPAPPTGYTPSLLKRLG